MKTESFETLEVGRKYLSRGGDVVKILLDSCVKYYPFRGDDRNVYCVNGSFYCARTAPHFRDLISRIVEPLTLQRWGVLWRAEDIYQYEKGRIMESMLSAADMPMLFKTRQEARDRASLYSQAEPKPPKVVKVKCTYEVLE